MPVIRIVMAAHIWVYHNWWHHNYWTNTNCYIVTSFHCPFHLIDALQRSPRLALNPRWKIDSLTSDIYIMWRSVVKSNFTTIFTTVECLVQYIHWWLTQSRFLTLSHRKALIRSNHWITKGTSRLAIVRVNSKAMVSNPIRGIIIFCQISKEYKQRLSIYHMSLTILK